VWRQNRGILLITL